MIGRMTHKAWSYRLRHMIGYAFISVTAEVGDKVHVRRPDGLLTGELVALPFKI